jgi:hypothetical protein
MSVKLVVSPYLSIALSSLAILAYITKYQTWYYTPIQGVEEYTAKTNSISDVEPFPVFIGPETHIGALVASLTWVS